MINSSLNLVFNLYLHIFVLKICTHIQGWQVERREISQLVCLFDLQTVTVETVGGFKCLSGFQSKVMVVSFWQCLSLQYESAVCGRTQIHSKSLFWEHSKKLSLGALNIQCEEGVCYCQPIFWQHPGLQRESAAQMSAASAAHIWRAKDTQQMSSTCCFIWLQGGRKNIILISGSKPARPCQRLLVMTCKQPTSINTIMYMKASFLLYQSKISENRHEQDLLTVKSTNPTGLYKRALYREH